MRKRPIRSGRGANAEPEKLLYAPEPTAEPMDLLRLTQSDLLQLLNGTPLGTVLTRSRLRRQIDAGAARFLTAERRVHFLRYVRWLVLEHERPRPGTVDYEEARRRQAARSRAATKAAQDIAPVPDVADWKRRQATCRSLRRFCETYFPQAFCFPWADAHLKAIKVLEGVIRRGGLFAFAMPRGMGKTTLARTAALWALLGNRVAFVCPIGAAKEHARRLLLAPIKTAILENDLLGADFPEAVYPLRCLENSSKRQLAQHVSGRLTHVRWQTDRIVFPTIRPEDLPASFRSGRSRRPAAQGSVYAVTSLDSHFLGLQHTRPDGAVIRPRLVLLDDPQTRESARSAVQTEYRHELIHGAVLGLAGPGETIAAVVLCTKIYRDDLSDRLLDPERSPEWQSECTKLVIKFPKDEEHWDRYAEIRHRRIRAHRQRAQETEYYRRHRKAMDAGASVAWAHFFDRSVELSTLQHAVNLKLRNEATFFSEYQNDPLAEQISDDVLTPRQVAEKVNGRKRGTVPLAATIVTAFIDIHDRLLFYAVCAWQEDFTGYVIEYGTRPKQPRAWFALHSARATLRRAHPGRGADGAIQAGLEDLAADLLQREWTRTGGGLLRCGWLLVDIGYKPGIVSNVKHKTGGETMRLARGVGITAGRKPMSQYRRKPGEKHGHHWYQPSVRGTREFPHVAIDVNYWKSFLHARLATPAGEPGCLSLYGRKPDAHELFAEHVAGTETWTETTGHGRSVREWKLKPSKPDNHWLDCLVACAAAASMAGARLPGHEGAAETHRKKYTQADLNWRDR